MKRIDTGSFMHGCLAALAAMILASCGGGGGSSGTTDASLRPPASAQTGMLELVDAFAATLTGNQEVPPRPSDATGSGTVVINPATRLMSATLTTMGIAGISTHIHQAPPGMNGPIIFPLSETPPGSGIWTTKATLTEAQYNAFRVGGFYFNVHSAMFVDGEIRGQILAQQISLPNVPGALGNNTEATAPGITTGTTTGATGTVSTGMAGT